MRFVQLGKLEAELVGYMFSRIKDDWSIGGILDGTSDGQIANITAMIRGAMALIAAILVFTGSKVTAITILALLASFWNLFIMNFMQKNF